VCSAVPSPVPSALSPVPSALPCALPSPNALCPPLAARGETSFQRAALDDGVLRDRETLLH
jgi:hypothetical protein